MDHPSAPAGSPRTPPQQRPRAFSLRSDKSNGSKGKVDVTESPAEKAKRDSIWKSGSKANPNISMNESQPAAAAMQEHTTIQSLRGITHRDSNGNVIADPDLSNPTRPRFERPLDTIRSFEKAIDNGYNTKRRSSYNRAESYDQNQHGSRRNSGYFGGKPDPPKIGRSSTTNTAVSAGNENGPNPSRYGQSTGGYYGSGQRPDSFGGPNGQRSRYGANRMQSDSAIYAPGPRAHAQHPSQHTDMTNGSDSTGPWANSTDPSSENSSLDRGHPGVGAPNGSGLQRPIMEEQGNNESHGGRHPPQQYGQGRAPAVQEPRRPIALGNSGDAPPAPAHLPSTARPEPEKKKKGWLKRRFSKGD